MQAIKLNEVRLDLTDLRVAIYSGASCWFVFVEIRLWGQANLSIQSKSTDPITSTNQLMDQQILWSVSCLTFNYLFKTTHCLPGYETYQALAQEGFNYPRRMWSNWCALIALNRRAVLADHQEIFIKLVKLSKTAVFSYVQTVPGRESSMKRWGVKTSVHV